jgi:hypothetical protein
LFHYFTDNKNLKKKLSLDSHARHHWCVHCFGRFA